MQCCHYRHQVVAFMFHKVKHKMHDSLFSSKDCNYLTMENLLMACSSNKPKVTCIGVFKLFR